MFTRLVWDEYPVVELRHLAFPGGLRRNGRARDRCTPPRTEARRGRQRNSLRRRGGGLVGAKGEYPLVIHFILAVTVPYVIDEVQAFAEEVIPAVRSA